MNGKKLQRLEVGDLQKLSFYSAVKLNDEAIRASLISQLSRMSQPPRAILEEVRVHYGNAIADVVTIHNHPHCYEIKGFNDNIYRVIKQGLFYERSFKKMTLVTVARYVDSAEKYLPKHWGIISAINDTGRVKFSYVRPARVNPSFDKRIALHTLWKSELLDADSAKCLKEAKSFNRDQLADLIASHSSEDELLRFIGRKLADRAAIQESR